MSKTNATLLKMLESAKIAHDASERLLSDAFGQHAELRANLAAIESQLKPKTARNRAYIDRTLLAAQAEIAQFKAVAERVSVYADVLHQAGGAPAREALAQLDRAMGPGLQRLAASLGIDK